ncbi:protein-L-isoaspartate O-methyltransferase [Amycolatopsis magusensis]|uniref:protein-L-isoaspartate O-methyltransferase n=1 Tax=Amycolatopsis magusensis TaxID=882444 RepID=UPI0037B1CD2C
MTLHPPPELDPAPAGSEPETWISHRRNRLLSKLRDRGIGDRVLAALRAVPHHEYATPYFCTHDPTRSLRSRERTPRAWYTGLYSIGPLSFIQPGGTDTITYSTPVLATMLDLLDVNPGDRVLQLGTGTGFTAAVLHHLTQCPTVISREPDPAWARHARAKLSERAHVLNHPDLHLHGADKHDRDFQRIIVWHDVACAPPDWRDILGLDLPQAYSRHPVRTLVTVVAGAITKLTLDAEGLTGTFHGTTTTPPARDTTAPSGSSPHRRLEPYPFLRDELDLPEFRLLLHLAFPLLQTEAESGGLTVTDPESWSRAELQKREGRYAASAQHGAYRLWDDITALAHRWDELGRPHSSQLTLTCRGSTQIISHGSQELHRRPSTYPTATPHHHVPTHLPGTHHVL